MISGSWRGQRGCPLQHWFSAASAVVIVVLLRLLLPLLLDAVAGCYDAAADALLLMHSCGADVYQFDDPAATPEPVKDWRPKPATYCSPC
jgi:hypothetical protein